MANNLSQFWQELKRRNVVRVVTVYAGAAFVIIELINNITEPLKLPDWTPTLVIVLLAIGFPIAIIFSWIYDIQPEGGIVKTEPAEKVKEEDIPKYSKSWKIASYISFIVILGLIVLNVIPRTGKKEILDKSIAVLPFINDSPDKENTYFINGIMEAILDNLCKIEDLRVVSRTSVLKYIDDPKSIPEIGREMNVSYILEGSGQKYGNTFRLTLQLIDAVNDMHIWSSPYTSEVNLADIFDFQSDIAKRVAKEIEVVITPEEQKLIEKIPTSNQTAYDLYQKGVEERQKYYSDPENEDGLDRATELFHYAIEYDSTFALPYVKLGWIYWNKFKTYGDSLKNLKDSATRLADRALELDPQFAEAHSQRGFIYTFDGERDLAIVSFDRAIELNPNFGEAYNGKGWLHNSEGDYVKSIENFYKSSLLDRAPRNLMSQYASLSTSFSQMGFFDLAEHYCRESLKLHEDSAYFYRQMAELKSISGHYDDAIDIALKGYAIEPDWLIFSKILGRQYLFKGLDKESLEYYEPYVKILDSLGVDDTYGKLEIAYCYLRNGFNKKADYYIDRQIRQSTEWIKPNRKGADGQYIFLAQAYAIRGDKERTIENLRYFNRRKSMNIYVMVHRNSTIFEFIKDEPEFQKICDEMEAKYQAEHERVRKWLEENDML